MNGGVEARAPEAASKNYEVAAVCSRHGDFQLEEKFLE